MGEKINGVRLTEESEVVVGIGREAIVSELISIIVVGRSISSLEMTNVSTKTAFAVCDDSWNCMMKISDPNLGLILLTISASWKHLSGDCGDDQKKNGENAHCVDFWKNINQNGSEPWKYVQEDQRYYAAYY